MTWFKVDDTAFAHPKMYAAGNASVGLWMRMGAWSSQNLTDGFVPRGVARQYGSAAEIARLVACGLWEPCTGGYQFHDWDEYQPTRAEVQERRRKTATKVRDWRARNQVTNPAPDPTRPVKEQKTAVVELDSRRSAGRE